MACVRLDTCRLLSDLPEEAVAQEKLVLLLRVASDLANSYCNRRFGHAVEFIRPGASGAVVTAYGHRLQTGQSVLLSGTGVSGLDGEYPITANGENQFTLNGKTVTATTRDGYVCVPLVINARQVENTVHLSPGPVAKVSQIRVRSMNPTLEGAFPDTKILDPSLWRIDTRDPEFRGRLEIFAPQRVMQRVPGRIKAVPTRFWYEVEASYYAGFQFGVPDDLAGAICGIVKDVANDTSGAFQQESFEDYSYQRMDPALLRAIPTSAIAVLKRYQEG